MLYNQSDQMYNRRTLKCMIIFVGSDVVGPLSYVSKNKEIELDYKI